LRRTLPGRSNTRDAYLPRTARPDNRTTRPLTTKGKGRRGKSEENAERPTSNAEREERREVRAGETPVPTRETRALSLNPQPSTINISDYGRFVASILISCRARTSKSSARVSQRFSALPPFLRSAAANPVGLRFSL